MIQRCIGMVLLVVLLSQVADAQSVTKDKRKSANVGGAGAEVDAAAAKAASHIKPDRLETYKKVGDVTLQISIFNPPELESRKPVPGIVFFHGGGFTTGAPANFYPQAEYLAKRGMVAMSVEYRIKSRHNTTRREATYDAMSAMRWVHDNTERLGIDPKRIAVAGGSAGGFLAAAVTTLSGLDEPGEDTTTSTRPNALLLFNASMDFGPDSRGFDRVQAELGDRWKTISPLHNLYPNFPPTIHFLGTKDKNISVESAKKMKSEIEAVGGRCDLHLYEGQEHGFFNYGRNNNEHYKLTLIETDRFLASIGYIEGEPTLGK